MCNSTFAFRFSEHKYLRVPLSAKRTQERPRQVSSLSASTGRHGDDSNHLSQPYDDCLQDSSQKVSYYAKGGLMCILIKVFSMFCGYHSLSAQRIVTNNDSCVL